MNHLKNVIGLVISYAQSAFVPHWTITDNVIIGYECLHTIRGYKSSLVGMATLKLHLSKMFDKVEWSYLHCIMKKLGCHELWISQIMRCISSVTLSIRHLDRQVERGSLLLSSLLALLLSHFLMKKRYRERGSPCLIPLEGENESVGKLLCVLIMFGGPFNIDK